MQNVSKQDLKVIREIIKSESYALGLKSNKEKLIFQDLLIEGDNNYVY
jgi:hypothetical protein